MTDVIRVIGYVIITLVLCLLLKELGFKGARLIVLICTVAIIGGAVVSMGSFMKLLPGVSDSSGEYAIAVMKMIGVGYAFGVCSDICVELGEIGLSSAVCLFGRVEIVALSAPYIRLIIEKGIEML